MNHREQLLVMVEHLVQGRRSVPEFEAHYYLYFVDDVPDDALSEHDAEFFGAVHEKLDWTDASPDAESRGHGWIDHEEYRKWVAQELARYQAGSIPR